MKMLEKIEKYLKSKDREERKYGWALVLVFKNYFTKKEKEKLKKIWEKEDKRIFNTNVSKDEREFLTKLWKGNGWRYAFKKAIEDAINF